MNGLDRNRRGFLVGTAGAGLVLISSAAGAAEHVGGKKPKGGDVPPTEDLMREHGILRRILLIYDEAARRLVTTDATAAGVVVAAADIVHVFVEGYHEKLEEQFVFPKMEKAGKLQALTGVLRVQHAAGRKLTEGISNGAKSAKSLTDAQRRALVVEMQSFGRMYTAHAAWEDTELFPVYRAQFTEAELDELGDRFEGQEHKLLGAGGFEGSLKEVRELERALGINDLARYTPV